MYCTIRIAGYGGYGIVTASRILGLAFTTKGFHVLQTETHGAAARGGTCTADLIIASEPIYELHFEKPNTLIILSASAFTKCCTPRINLSSNLLLIETNILEEPAVQMVLAQLSQRNSTIIYKVSIRKIAEDLGHVRYIGIAALGALAAVDKRVDMKLLEKTIKSDNKLHRFKSDNLKALNEGATAITLLKP